MCHTRWSRICQLRGLCGRLAPQTQPHALCKGTFIGCKQGGRVLRNSRRRGGLAQGPALHGDSRPEVHFKGVGLDLRRCFFSSWTIVRRSGASRFRAGWARLFMWFRYALGKVGLLSSPCVSPRSGPSVPALHSIGYIYISSRPVLPPGYTLDTALEHQMVPSGTEINVRRATNSSPSTATSALGWGIAVLADTDTFFFDPPPPHPYPQPVWWWGVEKKVS